MYQRSEQHKSNALLARQKANAKSPCPHCAVEFTTGNMVKHEPVCVSKSGNERFCKECSVQIFKLPHQGEFCTRKCGATYNNRFRTKESRQKQAISVSLSTKGKPSPLKGRILTERTLYKTCPCGQPFNCKKKPNQQYCSIGCVSSFAAFARSHKWGRCLSIPYTLLSGETITLQSTWEVAVADYLTENNIRWERPASIPWIDSTGKKRRYYPDFYLPDHDLYLDPKNPRVMARDQEKIRMVSQEIRLLVGPLEVIFEGLQSL